MSWNVISIVFVFYQTSRRKIKGLRLGKDKSELGSFESVFKESNKFFKQWRFIDLSKVRLPIKLLNLLCNLVQVIPVAA